MILKADGMAVHIKSKSCAPGVGTKFRGLGRDSGYERGNVDHL